MTAIPLVVLSVIICVISTFAYKRQPEYEEVAYKTWGDELGSSMVSVKLLGQVIIVLNSIDDANELLVKRSLKYSNRVQIPMLSSPRLTGWGKGTALLTYGDRFRRQRKASHEVIQKKTLKPIWPAIVKQTRLSMQRVLSTTDIESEIAQMVGTAVLQFAYGYEVADAEDPMVEIAKAGMRGFSDASMPADFLVNVIPWLEYVPSWFPGAGWKRKAKAWSIARDDLITVPFEWTKQQMANGTAQPSALKAILAELANDETELDRGEEEDIIKWAIGSLYGGAMDTTTSSILVFMLAMIQNPDVQAKAQAEIDAVVGDRRLPEMDDEHKLPYVGRVIKEVFRWRPVIPLGVPHACAEDDTYKGYFIPKDAIVMGNIWAMSFDREVYLNPDTFNPDRFSDPQTPDPPAFGFGRRICPGQYFANATLFLTVATMLSAFDIRPGKDEQGNIIIPDTKLTGKSLVR
ncbi:O-methylsterigmatocystin oxidoreductase Short=OMST oxidoreductase [Rhizoctonia solani AG-1 IB]|uniref:O-methylsterigmatocystin oxidoreductase Short=OMST oxidoreductase n=1 Tax=Thanatephorus cucumeris (strain AG1-IB / isolate 7/3/14) TaxID=1108050 RepID=M5C9E4_THACB|nr:O-methylsterigmatocystin oxidoreductase Short=OMST oxidoreductase [Rhizoctonia solani AG-1 IB]